MGYLGNTIDKFYWLDMVWKGKRTVFAKLNFSFKCVYSKKLILKNFTGENRNKIRDVEKNKRNRYLTLKKLLREITQTF